MEKASEQYLKRPLYVLNLPEELLASLVTKAQQTQHSTNESDTPQAAISGEVDKETTVNGFESETSAKGSASCTLCNATFPSFTAQRQHTRTDWHGYNLKQRMNGLRTVSELEFDKLIDELDLSISGSEDESSDDDDPDKTSNLTALLRKQAKLHGDNDGADDETKANGQKNVVKGSPMVWFSSSLIPQDMSIGIYKALFHENELSSDDLVNTLRKKQLHPFRPARNAPAHPTQNGPSIFLCMIGGGHFAGMIVSLTPKVLKGASAQEERQAIVLAHKTFHRYTTRRKQGGSQSANDASKGNAHSAGAGIRRANEAALEAEIRALLIQWKDLIKACDLLFVRASGVQNRRTLFGGGPDQVLKSNDPRIRGFPFNTRRATQGELMRAFVELTRAKVTKTVEAPAVDEKKKEAPKKAKETKQDESSKEEQEALLHTSQMQALIRRSKASALVSYINNNSLSPDYVFHPADSPGNRHAPTPLHLAASTNAGPVVLALLSKVKANPTMTNQDGKTAFELAGDRSTRDAFRIARSELGTSAWDWSKSHVPSALTKAEAENRDRAEKAEEQKAETARRKIELDRLERERGPVPDSNSLSGKTLATAVTMTAEDRREVEGRGLTPEMRARLERERRARAAEERMKKSSGKS